MDARELRIRDYLTAESVILFDDMYHGRQLGAAANLVSIGKMYLDIAGSARLKGLSSVQFIERIMDVSEYYIAKRGNSAYVIVTAIKIMTNKLKGKESQPLEDVVELLRDSVHNYNDLADEWKNKIKEYGYNVIQHMDSMLVYDYSSSVNALMEAAAEHGKKMTIYVPESRVLDGGKPFVVNGLKMGHDIHFFPDVAMAAFVEKCDVAFIGAETFFPDGCCANTVGSDIVAALCKIHGKPFYVPTALIKVNMRAVEGYPKEELWSDFGARIASHWEDDLKGKVTIKAPDLSFVPAQDITGYITEQGVIPSAAIFGVSMEFARSINS